MNTVKEEKVYVGSVEALELVIEYGFDSLPTKNKQWVCVPSLHEMAMVGTPQVYLGKDAHGYFIQKEYLTKE